MIIRDNSLLILHKSYVVTPHLNRLVKTVQMMGHNQRFQRQIRKIIPNYSQIPPLI